MKMKGHNEWRCHCGAPAARVDKYGMKWCQEHYKMPIDLIATLKEKRIVHRVVQIGAV